VRLPLELPAQLYVEHDAVVVARSAGTIDGLYAELGDRVSAGQLLARLESTDQGIALAGAEASFESVTRTAARTRLLKQGGGATAADSEQVEFQLRQADVQ
jgi:multidrug resistance efflux pump